MKLNIKSSALYGGLAAIAVFSGTAQAQITFSASGSLTAWNGSPTYLSLANSALSGATTGQGDATITGSYGLMAEIFTPTSSFTLGSIGLLMQVNSSTTYQINLYHLGPAGTVSVSSSAATYTPGTSLFSDNLISLSTTGGEVQGTFTLPAVDQVTLLANEQYAIEIWTPLASGSSGFLWYRGSTVDPGGQMFSGADSANARATLVANGQAGGAPRTGALELYAAPVPEPASMALLGLGALIGAFAVRRSGK